MTVQAQTTINSYIGNGFTKIFPYTFKILTSNDISVYVNDVLQSTGYVVSNVGNTTGGNVTFTTAPPSNNTVVFRRNLTMDRTNDYLISGVLDSDTLDADLDRAIMLIQDVKRDLTINGSIDWTYVNNKPTTLYGYGITDAAPLVHTHGLTVTGDVTGSGTGAVNLTLSTVNSSVGIYGSSTAVPVITVNAKGLITSVTTASTASVYQPLDADLTAIAALTGTSGFLKTNGTGTWTVDTSTYLTTASATSTYEPKITAGTTAQYWRGDKTWQTLDKTSVGLGSVENTALSTWAGTSNITTIGAANAVSVAVSATTASTSKTTGAVTVGGGLGVSGAINATSFTVDDTVYLKPAVGVNSFIQIYSNGQSNNNITISQGYNTASDNIGFIYNRANADFIFGTNNTARAAITAAGAFQSAVSIGYGYVAGTGGTVTQATSKATGVTLNKICGAITMNAAALAASTSVSFTLTNSTIAATDVVIVNIKSGATANAYTIDVQAVAAGSCSIHVRNVSAGSLSEALVLNFAVIKAVAA